MKKILDVLIGIFEIGLFFLGYIVYNIGLLIIFVYKRIVNLFTKKCKKKESEIVAVEYYSEHWPDLITCTIYEKGKYNIDNNSPWDNIELDSNRFDVELDSNRFDVIRESIKKERLLAYKHYIGGHLVSIIEFKDYFMIDGGPTNQRIWFIFKDGTIKEIDGYSDRIERFIKVLNDVTPEDYYID